PVLALGAGIIGDAAHDVVDDRPRAGARIREARRRPRHHRSALGRAFVGGAVLALGARVVRDAAHDVAGRSRHDARKVPYTAADALAVAYDDVLAARIEPQGEVVATRARSEADLAPPPTPPPH